MKKKRPTIKDVAELSETSITTVSRVLNETDYPVKQKLVDRVLEAAKELNYKPNIYGQMLKNGVSNEIGIVVPNLSNPYYSQMISVIEQELISTDYTPIIFSSFNDVDLEKKHINTLLQRQVAGILFSSIGDVNYAIDIFKKENVEFVLFDQDFGNINADVISFDFYKSGYMAVEFLIQNNHKNIAFLTAPFDRPSRKLLYEGYKNALKDNNIKLSKELTIQLEKVQSQNDEYKNGNHLAQLLLKKDNLPDAVVAINDITAIGIINELEENGINIPEDLSVISFDDITFAKMFTPALTTIRQPYYTIATRASKMLLRNIRGKDIKFKKEVIEPEIIIRDTVKIKT